MNLLRLIFLALLVAFVARRVISFLMRFQRPAMPVTPAPPQAEALRQCPLCKEYLTAVAKACGRVGCPRSFVLAFLAVLLVALPAAAEEGGRYLVEISGSNLMAKLEVNGVAVDHWQFEGASSAGASLNHWLRRGANSIRFTASALHGGHPVALQARVYFLGLTSAGGMNTVNLLNLTKLDEVGQGKSVSFNVPSAPLLALWQTEAVQLDEEARHGIVALLENFQVQMVAAVRAGGSLPDIPLLQWERQDVAGAYGGSIPPATSQGLAVVANVAQDKVEAAPLPEGDQLELVSLAEGRLVRVGRRQVAPLLGVRKGATELVVSALLVGRSGGEWRVLRRLD
jgi:hypothetical protein